VGLIHGVDSTGKAIPLLVDASGRAIVIGSGAAGEVEVVQTTPADLTPGIYAWDGSAWAKVLVDTSGRPLVAAHAYYAAWVKQPVLFGITGSLARAWSGAAVSAGVLIVTDTAVPANTLWVITNYIISVEAAAATAVAGQILAGGTGSSIFKVATPSTLILYDRQGWWILQPGDQLRVIGWGLAIGEKVYGYCLGFTMDVTPA
jgi:hypothetical protein